MKQNILLLKLLGASALTAGAILGKLTIPTGVLESCLLFVDYLGSSDGKLQKRVRKRLQHFANSTSAVLDEQGVDEDELTHTLHVLLKALEKDPPTERDYAEAQKQAGAALALSRNPYMRLARNVLAKLYNTGKIDRAYFNHDVAELCLTQMYEQVFQDDELSKCLQPIFLEDIHRAAALSQQSPYEAFHENPRPGEDSAFKLLHARYRVVPFHDPKKRLANLLEWCDDVGSKLKVRIYRGSGGIGKTRLAIEAYVKLIEEDGTWGGGFLDKVAFATANQIGRRRVFYDFDKVFIVIDYAESVPEEIDAIIDAALEAMRENETLTVRIVLLARASGDWVDEIGTYKGRVNEYITENRLEEIGQREALSIPAGSERRELYDQAKQAMATALGLVKVQAIGKRNRDLSDADFGRPLNIVLAATLDVIPVEQTDRIGEDGQASTVQDALLSGIIGAEMRRLRDKFGNDDIGKCRQVLSLLTLSGTLNKKMALDLIAATPAFQGMSPWQIDEFVSGVAAFYSRDSNEFQGLVPDVIGEHFVARYGECSQFRAISTLLTPIAQRNAVHMIVRVLADGSRHGPDMRQRAVVLLGKLVTTKGTSRDYIHAYLCHTLCRQMHGGQRLVAYLCDAGALTPHEALSFVLSAGSLSDFIYLLSALDDASSDAIMEATKPASLNVLVHRAFDRMIVQNPFGKSKGKYEKTYQMLAGKLDMVELMDAVVGDAATYDSLLMLADAWPTTFAKQAFDAMTPKQISTVHKETRSQGKPPFHFASGVASGRPAARVVFNTLGLEKVCDILADSLNMGQFAGLWRKASKPMKPKLAQQIGLFRSDQWEAVAERSNAYDVAGFLGGPFEQMQEPAQNRVKKLITSQKAGFVRRCDSWHQRSSADFRLRVIHTKNKSVQRAVKSMQTALKQWSTRIKPHSLQKLERWGHADLRDKVAAYGFIWKHRKDLRGELCKQLWQILPPQKNWGSENYYPLVRIMQILRRKECALLDPELSQKLFQAAMTLIPYKSDHVGLLHQAWVLWDATAMMMVCQPDQSREIPISVPEYFVSELSQLGQLVEASDRNKDGLDRSAVLSIAGIISLTTDRFDGALAVELKRLIGADEILSATDGNGFNSAVSFAIASHGALLTFDSAEKLDRIRHDTRLEALRRLRELPSRDASIEWLKDVIAVKNVNRGAMVT